MPICINAKPALAVNSIVRTTKRFIQERPKVLYSSGFRLPARSPASRSLAEGKRFGEGRGALSATGGDIFDQPYKSCFFSKLLEDETYKQVGFFFTKDLLQHLTAGIPVPIVFLHSLFSL